MFADGSSGIDLDKFVELADKFNLTIDQGQLEQFRALQQMQQREKKSERAGLQTARRLKAESDGLAAHNEMLACALGACPQCWGTMAECRSCRGSGGPGSYVPDQACFDHFVMPAVRQLISSKQTHPENQFENSAERENTSSLSETGVGERLSKPTTQPTDRKELRP